MNGRSLLLSVYCVSWYVGAGVSRCCWCVGCSVGSSRQRLERSGDGPCWPHDAVEEARVLAGPGSPGAVVRHLTGGVKHVLLPDGGVSWWLPAGSLLPPLFARVTPPELLASGALHGAGRWFCVSADGTLTSRGAGVGVGEGPLREAVPLHITADAATGARVTVRFDVSPFPSTGPAK